MGTPASVLSRSVGSAYDRRLDLLKALVVSAEIVPANSPWTLHAMAINDNTKHIDVLDSNKEFDYQKQTPAERERNLIEHFAKINVDLVFE